MVMQALHTARSSTPERCSGTGASELGDVCVCVCVVCVCVLCVCVCDVHAFLCGQFDQAHVCAVSRVHFVSRPVSRCIPCAEQVVLYERVVMLLTERANHPIFFGLVCSLAPSLQLANLTGACQKKSS